MPETNTITAILPYGSHWAIEETYAAAALEMIGNVDLGTLQARDARGARGAQGAQDEEGKPYEMIGSTAVLSIEGPMTKRETCMSWLVGGTSTLRTQALLRAAMADKDVKSVMLVMDTPGGEVAGTFALADAVAKAKEHKPIYAYVSDLCASAGYAIASQASKIFANRTAMVGSIGTYMVLRDVSEIAAKEGVKVHVIKAGEFKGAGMPGTPITEKQLEKFQQTVNSLNAQFKASVAKGRGMEAEQVDKLADGRVHVGEEALSLGLIDGVLDLDAALQMLQNQPTQLAAVGARMETTPPMNIKDRISAFFANLRGEAEMSDEDRQAIEAAEKTLAGEEAPQIETPVQTSGVSKEEVAEMMKAALTEFAASQQQTTQQAVETEVEKKTAEQASAAQIGAHLAAIEGLAKDFKISPAQAERYQKIAQDQPVAFAEILSALEENPRNPAVAGFAPGTEIEGLDGNEVARQLASEAPDNDLAELATKAFQSGKYESYQQAMLAVAKENPALVESRRAKTPRIH